MAWGGEGCKNEARSVEANGFITLPAVRRIWARDGVDIKALIPGNAETEPRLAGAVFGLSITLLEVHTIRANLGFGVASGMSLLMEGLEGRFFMSERKAVILTVMSFQPKDPDFESRVRASFAAQGAMRTLGVEIVRVAPGEVELSMPYSENFTQQHGYMHAGIVSTARRRRCSRWSSKPI